MHIAPPAELTSLSSPWSFAWCGIDLLGPFPKATGQVKYLVVAVDYSTKWIEADALAKITAKNVLSFFKRNLLARFGALALVISNNMAQFTDRKFRDYLKNLNIKHNFTSVKHLQTNGKPKSTNRVILRGILHHSSFNHRRISFSAYIRNLCQLGETLSNSVENKDESLRP